MFSAVILHNFAVMPSVPRLYSCQLVCQRTGDDKVAFPEKQISYHIEQYCHTGVPVFV
jgi:hypothetical protein